MGPGASAAPQGASPAAAAAPRAPSPAMPAGPDSSLLSDHEQAEALIDVSAAPNGMSGDQRPHPISCSHTWWHTTSSSFVIKLP